MKKILIALVAACTMISYAADKKPELTDAEKAAKKAAARQRMMEKTGGIIEKEAAIPACKVMLVCPKCKKPTRVGHKMTEGEKARKVRACKKCGAAFDN